MSDIGQLLARLVERRTVNPGGDELALARLLADELSRRGADDVQVAEVPREPTAGAYVYARFGQPRRVINVHLDTVPVNSGWTRDPFAVQRDGDRLYGLGTADTKGAIAATLRALDAVKPRDFGILFSGDEERGSRCIRHFLAAGLGAGIEHAVVCEPTARTAGVRHRGVLAYRARVRGAGGHSSRADHMPKPVVTMARLAVALDRLGVDNLGVGPDGMKGLCMNVASIDGGVAFNVVPDAAELSFSVRPPPGFDAAGFDTAVRAAARDIDPSIELEQLIDHRPFDCADPGYFERLLEGRVEAFVGLDFWTEAAVFGAAGINAVVVGPGDIAQAHAADEFVTVADLDWAVDLFQHVLATGD